MKKIIFTGLIFIMVILLSGCSVLEGRPDANNINQAEGSYVWWNSRQNYELESSQLNDQFGDQPGDANDARTGAINSDGQDFQDL